MNIKKVLICFVTVLALMIQLNAPVMAATKTTKATKKETTVNYTKKDLKLLACVIYTEAGNQPYKGKVAVGNVILNRIKDRSNFGHCDTLKEVIYDKKWAVQFGVTKGGSNSPLSKAMKNYSSLKEGAQMKACIKAAKAAFNGKDIVGKRLYFTGYSKRLANKHPNFMKIGSHIFY